MISFLQKHTLPCLYLAMLVLYFIGAVVNFTVDALTMPAEHSVDFAEVELYYLDVVKDNTLTSTGDDPQIIIYSEDIRTVYYRLQGQAKGVVAAYYTHEGEDYSDFMRLAPDFGQSGEVLYIFPKEEIDRVRIDPGSVSGEVFVFEEFVINKDIPLPSYLIPNSRLLLFLIALPCVINAALTLIFNKNKGEKEVPHEKS